MFRTSLLGIDRPNPRAPNHDDVVLGPSDSSDSGSDMTGLDAPDAIDPQLPLDRALTDDLARPLGSGDARGGGSDMAGTGERRSAAGDGGGREAGDIGVDQVFSTGEDDDDLPLPADVEAGIEETPVDVPEADEDEYEDEYGDDEDPGEDESADPVGDGRADAALAASLPPRPDRPNPEPDPPEDQPPTSPDGETPPADDGSGPHPPGRDPGRLRARS